MGIVRRFQRLMVGLACLTMIILFGEMAYSDETEVYVPSLRLSTGNFQIKYDPDSKVNYGHRQYGSRAESAVGSTRLNFDGPLSGVVKKAIIVKDRVSTFVEPCYVVETPYVNVKFKGKAGINSLKARVSLSRKGNESAGCS